MIRTSTAKQSFLATMVVVAGLSISQLGCSLRSLDYLKNGVRYDAGLAKDGSSQGDVHSAMDILSEVDGLGKVDGGSGYDVGAAIDGSRDGAGSLDGRLDSASGKDTSSGKEVARPVDGAGQSDVRGLETSTPIDGAGGSEVGAGLGLDAERDTLDGSDNVALDAWTADNAAAFQDVADAPDAPAFHDLVARDVSADNPAPGPTALFVVGAIPLTSADGVLETHLMTKGFAVTELLDKNVPGTTTVKEDLVLISRTVTATDVGATFKTTPKPVMVWESNIYDDMGMVDGTVPGSYGYTSGPMFQGYSTLLVNAGAGELAAGLSGTVTVLNFPGEMDFGVPSRNAITVAAIPDRQGQWAIFAYDVGAPMVGLTAPARRVGFFPSETSPSNLNSNGWALFDAAISWLMK
jgi:hypothetical protein